MSTFYVDTNGSNGNAGTAASPWVSLSFACSQVQTIGDIIHINAGVYNDNSQCLLSPGIIVQGASAPTVLIITTADPYISAISSVPTVPGNNDISGITFMGNVSNTAIASTGRNGQIIHDNVFENFAVGILVQGKAPVFVGNATTLSCNQYATATIASPNALCTVQPAATDWATDIQIYNNIATNTKFIAHTIKGAKIHHNTIDNSAYPGISSFGHTSYFWSGVEFYSNILRINSNTQTAINLEVWEIQDDTKFHDNIFDGWVSLILNTGGVNVPYSFEVCSNNFSSNATFNNIGQALEIGYSLSNVLVTGNFFTNTGSNNTYNNAISIWGSGTIFGYTVANNIIYNTTGPGIIIDSTFVTPGALLHPADIDNISISNNVFDSMGGGTSGGIRITNDGSSGRLDGIVVRNNIFQNLTYGLTFFPAPANVTGNVYSRNVINQATGQVNPNGTSTATIGTNYSFVPGILASGDRWRNYYRPNGPTSNLVGTLVSTIGAFF
jgi:hypothetical protein